MSLSRLPGRVGEITVDGNPTRVQASKTIAHDIAFHVTDMQLVRREIGRLNERPKVKPKDHELCSRCGKYVHISGFSPNKRKKNKLQSNCKACHAEIQAIADNAKLMERLNARMRKKHRSSD